MLYELKPSVVGRRIAIKDLQKLLAAHIKWHLPIKVTLKRISLTKKGWSILAAHIILIMMLKIVGMLK
jgi:hypothetical protein